MVQAASIMRISFFAAACMTVVVAVFLQGCGSNAPTTTTVVTSTTKAATETTTAVTTSAAPTSTTTTTTTGPTTTTTTGTTPPVVMRCSICDHFYNATTDCGGKDNETMECGDGVAFDDLPDTWRCPVCGQPKFVYMEWTPPLQ